MRTRPMPETITRSNINGQIATLTLDMPDKGANVLSSHVLNELEQHLDRLEQLDPHNCV